jgi:hypothetical protein
MQRVNARQFVAMLTRNQSFHLALRELFVWIEGSNSYTILYKNTYFDRIILAHFSKVGLCDIHAVCVCVSPLSTFECLNQSV